MSPSKEFIMDLARLTIAAAWADGDLANEEVNALKELLWGLQHVTEDDWKVLEMYMDHPVTHEEREELLRRVVEGISSSEHKALVIRTLTDLFEADGEVTAEEAALLREIEGAVAGAGTGVLALFAKAMKSAVGQRDARIKAGLLRETNLSDYVENTIYYRLQRRQEERGVMLDLPDSELRKLCLAAGVMARVAHVDDDRSAAAEEGIAAIVSETWSLSPEAGQLVATLTCEDTTQELDFTRIAYNYFTCTTHHERQAFLATLFRVECLRRNQPRRDRGDPADRECLEALA